MFKKLLITTAVLAATSSTIFAASAPYLGASLGLVNNTSTTANFRGIPLTIMGGFGAAFDQNFYLAGELFATLGTSAVTNDNPNSTSIRTSFGYGASVLPGVMVNDHTMLFGRFGIIKSRFSSLSTTANGGEFGLGLQANLMQNWDLRAEYDYIKYHRTAGISPKTDAFNIGLIYKFE